jgi:hypothetical protein
MSFKCLYKENRAIDTTLHFINLARQSLYVDMLNAIFLDLYYSDESIKYMQQFVQVVIIKMRAKLCQHPHPHPSPHPQEGHVDTMQNVTQDLRSKASRAAAVWWQEGAGQSSGRIAVDPGILGVTTATGEPGPSACTVHTSKGMTLQYLYFDSAF